MTDFIKDLANKKKVEKLCAYIECLNVILPYISKNRTHCSLICERRQRLHNLANGVDK